MEAQAVTTFGKILREERKRKKMNQSQLAELVGTTQQNIGHWEGGRTLPKQASYDKLLDVFGTDSRLSYLPTRGEIRLHEPIQSKRRAELDHGRVDLINTYTGQKIDEQVVDAMRTESANKPEQKLVDALPPEYRQYANIEIAINLGSMGMTSPLNYRVDYLSAKLCLVIRHITGNRMDTAARTGMQQLMLYQQILNRQAPNHIRKFVLALVLDPACLMLNEISLQRVWFEARLLDVDAHLSSSLVGAVHHIVCIEEGKADPSDAE
jgi:transcriptional regulator with XRE-family HTH domain